MADKRMAALNSAIAAIEKQWGKGAILPPGAGSLPGVEFIPTGCESLNRILGGGYARGRIVELFGEPSSGKSTLAMHAVAEAQAMGGNAALIDAEHATDPVYISNLGVDLDKLIVCQPDHGEQALGIAETLVQSGALDVIVIDSVAALVPEAELKGEMGDSHMGLHARLMSQTCSKITAAASRTKTCVIFINQMRMKIGVVFGNPNVTTGGKALGFYASQRIQVTRFGKPVEIGGDASASETRCKAVKNKVAPPFKMTEFQIEFGKGINKELDVLRCAVDKDIVIKSGSWYSMDGNNIAQGEASTVASLRENTEMLNTIVGRLNADEVLPAEQTSSPTN